MQLRRGYCYCGDFHCGDGDYDSGGCNSGDCDCDCSNGITAGAIGLKQARRLWYKDIESFFRSLGFTQSHPDRSLYIFAAGPSRVLLILYVDDISLAYASSTIKAGDNIKAKLAAKYRIMNL